VTESNLLDSSVWIAILAKNQNTEIINSNATIMTSSLTLFEIKRKLLRDKVTKADIEKALSFITGRSLIIDADEKIAELAAQISHDKNLPAMDALIYASARENKLKLITLDNDFRGLDNIEIINP
jgi:predicted nucleic acid-binding protein